MIEIAKNKKAYYDYEVIKEYTAGLELKGSEVKSIRQKNVVIKDSFVKVNSNIEAFAFNLHISKFDNASLYAPDPIRDKKLLLNKKELIHLYNEVRQKGFSIIPLLLFIDDNNYAKLKIGLCRGKKNYDKRASLKEKEIQRKIDNKIKN